MPPDAKKRMPKSIKETIHSGHFMVSEIDDNEVIEEIHSPSVVHESDCDQEASNDFQFEDIPKETKKEVYTFGPRSSHSISIEVSLTQLFQCMTLAYSGKLTSPRWKTFKGLKLRLKDKIRLNNIIWRAWHIQFISKRKPPVCQFASPLDTDAHNKSEVMVVEENLWKTKVNSIAAEYKKRRMYFKDRFRSKQRKASPESNAISMDWDSRWSSWSNSNLSAGSPGIDEDLVDFSDTLFSSFFSSQSFDLPYHREIAKVGIADFIQPGLVQLQPSIDDFMDTFESLQEFLTPKLPTLIEEGPEQNVLDTISSIANQQVPTFGNVSAPSKQFDISDISENSAPCESSYSLDEQSFQVHQQNTSSNIIGNINNSIHSQVLVQDMNPLTLDVSTRQSTLQNSMNPALNSSIVSSDVITSMSTALRTDQRNESSLNSFKSLNVPLTSEKCSVDQSTSNFNSTLNIATHNTKQPSFPVTGQLQTQLPSQVPLAMSSQTRNVHHERFINNRTSKNLTQMSSQSIQHNIGDINLSYQTPVHTANAIQSQMPLTTQSHIDLSTVNSSTMIAVKSESTLNKVNSASRNLVPAKSGTNELTNELAQIRRHSYTGLTVDEILSRKNILQNKPNIPNLTNTSKMAPGEKFVIPETPIKQRVRSRSVSSPQAGTMSTNSTQPSSSISMNNISTSPPPVSQHAQIGETLPLHPKNSFVSNTLANRNVSGILPQNAVLAQLLMSGTTIAPRLDGPLSFSSVTTTAATTTTTTLSSTVTIINSIPTLAATTPTFVLSPVAIATVASVPTLQRNLFVDTATNQIVGCHTSAQDCVPTNIAPALLNSSIDGSGSPNKPFRPKSDEERVQYKEHRRVCHINAEQKRRCNIKNGFESLRHLLPSLSQNPHAKVSKAAMLQKAAEYICTLKIERQQQQEEAELLRQQRDSLNESISLYQKQLPASGAPIPCQKTNRMKELFDDYVRIQTLQNWKFWIFSLLMEPLLEAYNDTVSTNSINELCESVLEWVNQHCSLITLRPGVLNSLRNLGTTTNILTDPTCLPEEATRAVAKKESNLH